MVNIFLLQTKCHPEPVEGLLSKETTLSVLYFVDKGIKPAIYCKQTGYTFV